MPVPYPGAPESMNFPGHGRPDTWRLQARRTSIQEAGWKASLDPSIPTARSGDEVALAPHVGRRRPLHLPDRRRPLKKARSYRLAFTMS